MSNKFLCISCLFCVLSIGFSASQDLENQNNNYAISDKNHNNLVYTYTLDNSLIRKEYDSYKRLIKKIEWNIESENQVCEFNYTYKENSMFPFSCEAVYFNDSIKEIIYFWENGKEKKIEIYKNNEKYLEQYYEYNDSNQIVYYSEKKFESKNDVSKILYFSEIKYQYVEFDSKILTNEYHFADGIKTKEKIYTSASTYYENNFFEGDIKIYSEYKNNKKVLEITYLQDKEIKRR